jgi:hypothetical protein
MAKEALLKYAKKVEKIAKRHVRKHGMRRMALSELDKLAHKS